MTEPGRVANQKQADEGGILETIKVIIQALLIALVVRTFLFQPFNIPSGSLIPTLLIGDYLFVSKYSYGYSRYSFPYGPAIFSGRIWAAEPKRGDIVVFKLPRDNATDYIKRVIGLPNDRIQMIDGILHINGEPVKKERLGQQEVPAGAGYRDRATFYRETLPNGVSYTIQELDMFGNRLGRNTAVYAVPAGHFFMMGDNRDNSLDSRDMSSQGVGYVPFENLIGRAEIIFFSIREDGAAWRIWEWPWTVRWNRLLKPVG
ncbi:signal peptidase I [Alsobacter sp. SYSU M60028]|uniref:Signal peptidase I n=1 Tax=Alsobacter ponti TaxID=2962936 RepID=A0ABT1LDQ7_9HYPH|nr:signal peptidase I [Alsobacter ponti]MCP8938373.1 signal peptidase I [Alsobacter ponti]